MLYPEEEPKQEETQGAEDASSSSKLKEEVKPEAEVQPAEDKPKEAKADKAKSPKGEKAKEDSGKADEKPKAKAAEKAKSKKAIKEPQKAGKKESKPEKKKGKEKPAEVKLPPDYIPRMLKVYNDNIVPALMKRFKYDNAMMVPRLEKIVLNVGIGEASQNPKLLESANQELAAITGQKPAVTKARKSISNFKLRQGMAIGTRVTLRGWKMWEFLDRLLNVAIPRIRDFRGLSDRSFDGRGNYTMGIKEQIIFPEIDIDKIERVHGLDISFVTTARTDEEAHAFLKELGVPFRRREANSKEQAA